MQEPKDARRYESMVKVLSCANTKKEMETMSLLYILDLSFERSDITLALHNVGRLIEQGEKGNG